MAIYLETLHVNSFRGIRELSVEGLSHINIIAGDNNSGKTSILEAIMLFKNPLEFSNVLRVSRLRDSIPFYNSSLYESFINLFPRTIQPLEIDIHSRCMGEDVGLQIIGEQKTILIDFQELRKRYSMSFKNRTDQIRMFDEGENETECFLGELHCIMDGNESSSDIEFHPYSSTTGREISRVKYLNVVYLSPVEHTRGNVFNRILREDSYKDICLHILRIFDPDIKDLLMLKNEITGRPVEYIKHESLGNMPLSSHGDGIKKVLSLANGIAQAVGGVLLIDEIETAIHSKYYDDIFGFIAKACKQFNVQVFITTHSSEAIDGLLSTQDYHKQTTTDDIKVLTFKKNLTNNKTYSRVLDGRHVSTNRDNFGFEVRL